HGLTYSGHPVSAAVGLAVLDLYLEGGILANGQARGPQMLAGLSALADHPLVGDVRGSGMLAAIELVSDKATKAPFAPALGISNRLSTAGYRNGIIFRAFADGTIGFAPALSCSEAEMDMLLARLRTTLDQVLDEPEVRNALA
ncbi:MAG TPA: aminotransferase class III-fold pyridoxal phosphate-dependent enzyme, partial [Afipia sp.]